MTGPIASADLWIACAFMPVLLVTAFFDLREMRIPNRLSWMGLAMFVCCLPVIGFEAWFVRVLIGFAAFAICFGLFSVGWLGGGDAKIFPVTILFVPATHITLFMFSFAAAMLLGMAAVWCARQFLSSPDAAWVSMQPGAAFPMGISIAASLPLALVTSLFVSP